MAEANEPIQDSGGRLDGPRRRRRHELGQPVGLAGGRADHPTPGGVPSSIAVCGRCQLGCRGGRHPCYSQHSNTQEHQLRPLRVPTWSLRMQTSFELDFLIAAVRNVPRAQRRIPEAYRPTIDGQQMLKLLRDVSRAFRRC